MQKLQLYISGTRVDLFKDESVSMTQSIQNVKDIAKIFTEFTKTFTLPASKTNNILFRHYYNFDIAVNSFDARNKVSANIELNNIPFKKGTIRLEGVELKRNKVYAYKVTFFGETVNLKDLLEDDELQDLDGLNTLTLDYTDTNIRTNLIGNLDALITPLITHTDQLYYDSATTGNGNVRWVNSSSTNQVNWKQLKFAVRLYEIIQAIETRYTIANGFASNLVFSTDFFNTSNAPFYNLYMWLHRKKGDVEPAQQVSLQYRQVSSFSLSAGSDGETSTSQGGIIISGLLVTYPNNIIGFALGFTQSSSTPYNVQIYRNGSLYFQDTNVVGNQPYSETDFNLTAGTYTIFVASASTLTFASGAISWEINGYQGGEGPGGGPIGGWTDTWTNSSSLITNTIFEFVITQQVPKMKIIDFLTALFKMFNLTAFVDATGTIVVKTLDSYYATGKGVLSGTEAWALDEYIDTSKSEVNVALPFKEIGFQYKGLKTFLAVQFEQLENTGWGSISYTLDNAKYDAPNETYKVEIPFEHMQFERLFNATGGGSTSVQWGWSVNENRESFHGLPLIFYGYKQSGTSISFGNDSGTKSELTTYIIPSNSLSINPSSIKDNIHFQVETNEYTDNSLFTDTLFHKYYETYISDVFDNARRLTKITAYLPLKIIYNLELNDRVSIGNQKYLINSLNTNLINGKSNLELLNVVL
jgi:hypothetical protein